MTVRDFIDLVGTSFANVEIILKMSNSGSTPTQEGNSDTKSRKEKVVSVLNDALSMIEDEPHFQQQSAQYSQDHLHIHPCNKLKNALAYLIKTWWCLLVAAFELLHHHHLH